MAEKPKPYADLGERIIEIVDWESLGVPLRHKVASDFRSIAKGISFTSTRSLETLSAVVADLCIYGFMDRAVQIALALGDVESGSTSVVYMPISSATYNAAVFADLTGHSAASELRELALHPPGKPHGRGPAALDGTMLRLLDEPAEGMPLTVFVACSMQDINSLSAMYLLGSPTWPPSAVISEIKRSVERIHRTRGFEPWTESAAPAWVIPAEPESAAPELKKRWWQRG